MLYKTNFRTPEESLVVVTNGIASINLQDDDIINNVDGLVNRLFGC